MTNNENIYDEWSRTLDGLGLQADDRSQQKARVVTARAQVDQAISLATIADSLDQLVAIFGAGRRPRVTLQPDPHEAEPEPRGIQSEHDVEVGDMVAAIDGGLPLEVSEVGIDQGDLWLKLEDIPGKVWASRYVVVERSELPDLQVIAPEPVVADAEPTDDLDDDFASEATDADEQQADALAALRARQGKGKKGGQKR